MPRREKWPLGHFFFKLPSMRAGISESSSAARLISIDALRGMAALGVVLYHAVMQTSNGSHHYLLDAAINLIRLVTSFGYIGVFLFFVISGFCIHLQWARARSEARDPQIKFRTFWARRIRRLYPPYLIALVLYLGMQAVSSGISLTRFFGYDLLMHLLMLHNVDWRTSYSINGVFWTLAIEEQLYLAYFVLLFLRTRWGWGPTLLVCFLARPAWFFLGHGIWLISGLALPVPEAAASHWFTWALGAISVEAAFGIIEIPRWCKNLWLGGLAILLASTISLLLPQLQKDTILHDGGWLIMHPLWGFGFFALVNRWVLAEKRWTGVRPRLLISAAAFIGIFSYSLYLTHELVIMQSWRFVINWLPPMANTFLVLTPITIIFAWVFFRFCEKPYMRRSGKYKRPVERSTADMFPVLAEEELAS